MWLRLSSIGWRHWLHVSTELFALNNVHNLPKTTAVYRQWLRQSTDYSRLLLCYRQPKWSNRPTASLAGAARANSARSNRALRLAIKAACTSIKSLSVCLSVCPSVHLTRLLGHFWSHIKYVYIVGKAWLSATQRHKFRVSTVQHWLMQLTFVYNVFGRYFKKYQNDVFELAILWNLDSSRT
jgi:hypothetical protein